MSIAVAREFRITGRAVLLGLIAFFGVIIAVNLGLVYFALHSWPGLSTDDAYQKGLHYNDTLASAAKQSELGWQSVIRYAPKEGLAVDLHRHDGAPIPGLRVTARIERAVGEPMRHDVTFTEVMPGTYGSPLKLEKAGRWLIEVTAVDSAGNSYRMQHALMVAP